MAPRYRLLVCVREYTVPVISNALSNAFSLHFCHDVFSAEQLLSFRFNAILCGTSFDDSRMMDMLRMAKNHEFGKTIPFIAIKATPSKFPETVFETLKRIAFLMGAADFIEFYKIRADLGEELANIQLRESILKHISQSE